MATLTEEQFTTLLGTLAPRSTTQPPVRNDLAALGPMRLYHMGTNKMTRLHTFEQWLEEADNRMKYIGTEEDDAKTILLKTWAGIELIDFMKKKAHVVFEDIPPVGENPRVPKDNYDAIIEKIKDEMKRTVYRTMAMHDLHTTKQGQKPWMDFVAKIEKKVCTLNFNSQPYAHDDAVRDAIIIGMADLQLKEKALTEDPKLTKLVQMGQAREAGRDTHLKKQHLQE